MALKPVLSPPVTLTEYRRPVQVPAGQQLQCCFRLSVRPVASQAVNQTKTQMASAVRAVSKRYSVLERPAEPFAQVRA
jgi:hypothetical protein